MYPIFQPINHNQHQLLELQKEIYRLYKRAHRINEQLSGLIHNNVSNPYYQYAAVNTERYPYHEEESQEYKMVPIGKHTLPPLPYDYNALEPYIDEQTMRIHHDKHHQSYVDGLNKAEIELQKARENNDYELIKHWERELAFNGAGHYLHTIFWNNMIPNGGGTPSDPIAEAIKDSFGSFKKFKQQFSAAAEKVEGNGWAALVWSPRSHRLEILQFENHQKLSQQDIIPLLVLDVWEHAYYLKYQNKRADYINAWWNIVNWDDVNRRFLEAQKIKWKPY